MPATVSEEIVKMCYAVDVFKPDALWKVLSIILTRAPTRVLLAAPSGSIVALAKTVVHNLQKLKSGREAEAVSRVDEDAIPEGQDPIDVVEVRGVGGAVFTLVKK